MAKEKKNLAPDDLTPLDDESLDNVTGGISFWDILKYFGLGPSDGKGLPRNNSGALSQSPKHK